MLVCAGFCCQMCYSGPGAGRACVFPPCLCCLRCTLLPDCITFDCGVIKGRNMPHRNFLFSSATQGQINLWPLVGVEMRGRKGPDLLVLASPEPTELLCSPAFGLIWFSFGAWAKVT